jgi:tetratricopeptide (TPR) repeat protein
MDLFEQAKSHFLTGLELLQRDDWPGAESELRQSLALMPDRLSTLINLSACLIKQEKMELARPYADRAVEIDPSAAEAWINCGLIAKADQDYEEALNHFDRAIALDAVNPDSWNNRGYLLYELQQFEDAIASYDKAIALSPTHDMAWANRGVACEALHRDQDALRSFQRALEYQPENLQARWSLCKLSIKLQDYPAGWEAFESRWLVIEPTPRQLESSRPRWNGQRSNQPLLLWGEQGIGDQILFASILPDLADFPQRKLLALDARLIPLFARSMPGFELLDLNTVSDALPFSEHLPLGSLPQHFRTTRQSFASTRHPYLMADVQRSNDLRTRLARRGKLICGVSWSSQRKQIGRQKSILLADMLTPLKGLALHFVNLQYGDTTAELQVLHEHHGIEVQSVDKIDNYKDLDGLAALVQACDVVLTTSNSTAHLAGALGKETLLLLPMGRSRLWYWMECNGRNPWYPSIVPFTQTCPNNWDGPLNEVRRYLQENYAD